ncbi:N-acetylglucosaminyl transferase component-domain-containing protein [Lipomyces arxii]|uniref:N-acetylglucosaminyl transferase component-domain-containing protein n=1 Tax=Lipomyces arxii TaxID=56418 RepID=UPI0034CDF8AE
MASSLTNDATVSNKGANGYRDRSQRNLGLHLDLPATPVTLTRGGISGARSVPVSSTSSPTEETGFPGDPHVLRDGSPRLQQGISKSSTTHTYRTGKDTTSNITYNYSKIFDYRTRVKAAVKEAAVHPFVTRVFWPTDCVPNSPELPIAPSVLVGFRNSKSDFVIIAIFPNVDIATVSGILGRKETLEGTLYECASLQGAYDPSKLMAVGTLNSSEEHQMPLRVHQDASGQPTFTSQEFPTAGSLPLKDSSLNNGHSRSSPMSFQIIFYQRPIPRRLQYFSYLPITLDLDNREIAVIDDSEIKEQKKRKDLVERMKQHQVFGFFLSDTEKCINIWINEINMSYELGLLLQQAISAASLNAAESRGFMSPIVQAFKPGTAKMCEITRSVGRIVSCFLKWVVIGIVVALKAVAGTIQFIIEWQPRANIPALTDMSATIQQIDLRLQQACHWPVQYMKLRDQKRDLFTKTTFHPEYIRFYNSLWLVANDIIIGAAVGAYIIDNKEHLVSFIDFCIDELLTTGLRKTIGWLMNWPGGLKLNNELGAFFGELFLWVIDFWGGYLRTFRPFLSIIVYMIGMSSFVGATFSIAMIADLISFLTIQIYSCYLVSARIYNWQLTVLVSLFHLFRGKRRNVLRNRIDSCDYDLDQLLIGTLLFTLLTFLLPTVLVFYLAFASARFGIIVLNAMLESSLVLLNHFPLFAIMLRLKDSKRLPGGIEFDVMFDAETNPPDTVYIRLKPLPLPVTAMFHQYLLLSRRIQRHYLSFRVISLLLTGQFVPRANHQ